mmetsp:Transcript_82463/g.163686  ORF Transcript_82463/g.163686 Transcript_82463/m.163686 type:complete len:100 (-) Transcript_82463:963-1262(-)
MVPEELLASVIGSSPGIHAQLFSKGHCSVYKRSVIDFVFAVLVFMTLSVAPTAFWSRSATWAYSAFGLLDSMYKLSARNAASSRWLHAQFTTKLHDLLQ